jgi:AcrR family transcriptional regulator
MFQEKGYEAASTEEIGRAVGLLKGSLYYYIESKEDLLFHVIWGVHVRVAVGVESACAALTEPLDRLRAFLERHFVLTAEDLPGASVFYRDFRSLGDERRQVIIGLRDSYESFLRELLGESQEAGVVCPDLDLKLAATGILSVLNSIHLWYSPDVGRSPDEMAQLLADFVLGGLQCSPEFHQPGHRSLLGRAPGVSPHGAIDMRDRATTVLDLRSNEADQ